MTWNYIHTTHITCTLQLQYDDNYKYIDITITITTSLHYIHRYVTCVCVCLCGFVCLLAHLHECWRLEYLLNACFCKWVCWLLLPGAIAVLYNHATSGSSHLNWDSMCQWAPSSPLKSLWKSSKPGTASGSLGPRLVMALVMWTFSALENIPEDQSSLTVEIQPDRKGNLKDANTPFVPPIQRYVTLWHGQRQTASQTEPSLPPAAGSLSQLTKSLQL